MDAVILAGGFGKRILPLTHYLPKPMLPIANLPVIDYLVSQTVAANAENIIFTLAYMPETIISYVSGYLGIKTRFCIEEMPLGTAGGVKNAAPAGDFAVLSGDGISDIDLSAMLKLHKKTNALVTIAVTEVKDLTGYGKMLIDGDMVTAINEKDKADEGKRGLANTGVYIISPKALEYVDGVCDFARDLFPMLLGRSMRISAYVHKGYWKDIGNCDSYLQANIDLIGKKFFPCVRHIDRPAEVYTDKNVIGRCAVVSGRASECVIGEYSTVCSDANLRRCVVLPGAVVSGRHSGEIIGSDFYFKAANPDINLFNLQKSVKYYC